MPHEFCLHFVPWHKLYTLSIEFSESPCNLFLPGRFNMLVDFVLKALQLAQPRWLGPAHRVLKLVETTLSHGVTSLLLLDSARLNMTGEMLPTPTGEGPINSSGIRWRAMCVSISA